MPFKCVPFYNISQAVGKGGINENLDVMLIQFFLSEIAKKPPFPIPPPTNPLPVKGNSGDPNLLIEWIGWFQRCNNQVFDQRVDPAKTYVQPTSIKSNFGWVFIAGTMVNLNATYRRRFQNEHDALEKAPNCPGELRAALFINHSV